MQRPARAEDIPWQEVLRAAFAANPTNFGIYHRAVGRGVAILWRNWITQDSGVLAIVPQAGLQQFTERLYCELQALRAGEHQCQKKPPGAETSSNRESCRPMQSSASGNAR